MQRGWVPLGDDAPPLSCLPISPLTHPPNRPTSQFNPIPLLSSYLSTLGLPPRSPQPNAPAPSPYLAFGSQSTHSPSSAPTSLSHQFTPRLASCEKSTTQENRPLRTHLVLHIGVAAHCEAQSISCMTQARFQYVSLMALYPACCTASPSADLQVNILKSRSSLQLL